MARVAAIDFETANNRPNSACQIGIVVLNEFEVIEERCWLIKPPELYFSPFCVRVHGITARDCIDAPSWADIWPEVEELIGDAILLGHNVGFDARVLQATSTHYGLPVPTLDLLCSRVVAKRAWPALPGHGLANVAKHLRIDFKHHDALEDARASAAVLSQAAELAQVDTVQKLETSLGLIRGTLRSTSVKVPRTSRLAKSHSDLDSSLPSSVSQTAMSWSTPTLSGYDRGGMPTSKGDAHRRALAMSRTILAAAKEFQPLAGKHVVLVHSLLGLDRDDAVGFLQDLGATVYSQLNLKTQLVILGTPGGEDGENLRANTSGDERTLADVEKRKSLGQSLRIISQRQLLALIPGASEIVRGE